MKLDRQAYRRMVKLGRPDLIFTIIILAIGTVVYLFGSENDFVFTVMVLTLIVGAYLIGKGRGDIEN